MAYFPPFPTQNQPYPSMFVEQGDIKNRRAYFVKNKLQNILKVVDSVPDYISFTFDAFKNLIRDIYDNKKKNYLRFLFAVDDTNTFTIIFAPAELKIQETEYYYLPTSAKFESLDSGTASKWITRYKESGGVRDQLDSTINQNPTDSPSDTNYIDHEIGAIAQIWTEIIYQNAAFDNEVTSLRIWFSSYTDNDARPSDINIIDKRLIAELLLVHMKNGSEEILYIDNPGRHRAKAFNTGNLCPPNCHP